MGAYLHQARLSFRAYLDRGYKVISALEEQDLETALIVLRWRDAAYHNFRAADALEQKSGNDLESDTMIAELYKDIVIQNIEIADLLVEACDFMKKDEQHLVKNRSLVAKFHSGSKEVGQIQKSI